MLEIHQTAPHEVTFLVVLAVRLTCKLGTCHLSSVYRNKVFSQLHTYQPSVYHLLHRHFIIMMIW